MAPKQCGLGRLLSDVDVIEAYERQRWPDGKFSGGKG
jgi:hypothetical protein